MFGRFVGYVFRGFGFRGAGTEFVGLVSFLLLFGCGLRYIASFPKSVGEESCKLRGIRQSVTGWPCEKHAP